MPLALRVRPQQLRGAYEQVQLHVAGNTDVRQVPHGRQLVHQEAERAKRNRQ